MKHDLAWVTHHSGFVPSLLLVAAVAALLHAARRSIWYYALLSLPGTIAHEGMHLLVGLFVWADPHAVSFWPRRAGARWQLGSVTFSNLNLWNAAFVTLAPLLLVPLSVELFTDEMLALWAGGHWGWWLLAGYATAAILVAGVPSSGDIRLGARSIVFYAVIGVVLFALHAFLGAA